MIVKGAFFNDVVRAAPLLVSDGVALVNIARATPCDVLLDMVKVPGNYSPKGYLRFDANPNVAYQENSTTFFEVFAASLVQLKNAIPQSDKLEGRVFGFDPVQNDPNFTWYFCEMDYFDLGGTLRRAVVNVHQVPTQSQKLNATDYRVTKVDYVLRWVTNDGFIFSRINDLTLRVAPSHQPKPGGIECSGRSVALFRFKLLTSLISSFVTEYRPVCMQVPELKFRLGFGSTGDGILEDAAPESPMLKDCLGVLCNYTGTIKGE